MNFEEHRTFDVAELKYNHPRGLPSSRERGTGLPPTVGRANITVKTIMTRETQINRGMRPPEHTSRRARGFNYLTSRRKS